MRQYKQPVLRGTARAKRREYGNYSPVNTEASLKQAPNGRYAKKIRAQPKKQGTLAEVTAVE